MGQVSLVRINTFVATDHVELQAQETLTHLYYPYSTVL